MRFLRKQRLLLGVVAISAIVFVVVISTSLQLIQLDQRKWFGEHDHFVFGRNSSIFITKESEVEKSVLGESTLHNEEGNSMNMQMATPIPEMSQKPISVEQSDEWTTEILYPVFSDDIMVFHGSTLVSTIPPHRYYDDDILPSYSFTIVCALQYSEFFYLSVLKEMWLNEIVIAVFIPVSTDRFQVEQEILDQHYPDRIQIVTLFQRSTDSTHYPINYLRNLAISMVHTSHYMVIDSGVLLERHLALFLSELSPPELGLQSVLTLPLFFSTNDGIPSDCRQKEICLREYVKDSSLM